MHSIDVAVWLGLGILAVIVVTSVLLERLLERRLARSAWGELLQHDAAGRTFYVPFGDVAYLVEDPVIVGRVERLWARGFGLMEAGAVCVGAAILTLVALELHSVVAGLALGAAVGWAAVVAWSVREARAISSVLRQRSPLARR